MKVSAFIRKSASAAIIPIALMVITVGSVYAQKNDNSSLKVAYAEAFKMGAAISSFDISERNPQSVELILKHFNAITTTNEMKPESLHPRPDVWNFTRADALVDFGREHDMWILGHTLCWHNQTPEFFWMNENGQYKSHDELVETLRSYIETVCTHFGNKVNAWDVVNEIIGEKGEYRNIGWVKAFGGNGEEVVKLAFKYADQYCPKDVELYYNDFNVWRPAHLQGIIEMVKMLQAEGLRVDGVGIQAHWGLNYPKNEYIENAIDRLSELGVKVMITELDVDVLPITREGQVIGKSLQEDQFQLEEFKAFLDPYQDGLPAEIEDRLAERYTELFRIFYNHRDQIDRVTFWGLHDGTSWKNGYPIPQRTNYPLLFYRDYTPHKAFHSVVAIPDK